MKKKKLKKGIIIILVIVIILIIFLCYFRFFNNKNSNNKKDVKIIDEIKEYGYYLNDNDTNIYKEEFKSLIKILNEKEINYEKYAVCISKLFIMDFYDLNNKTTNADIGGIQYIYKDSVDNFVLNAKDTIYKSVESNIYGDRKQNLPIVKNVINKNIEDTTYKIDKTTYDGYSLNMKIEYKEDLNYPQNINITVIKNDKKLEIVKVSKE